MKYFVSVNGKKYEVVVESASGNEPVEKKPVSPVVEKPVAPRPEKAVAAVPKPKAPAAPAGSASGEETVKCPMPGTIMSVKVKEGESIKKGTVLFVLEAMKMENEILASRDCVVMKVAVADGASVKTGDLLAILK